MHYRAFDIVYDTDGDDLGLPTELNVELGDDADPDTELADAVSNQTGWCVESLNYEALSLSPRP